MKSRLVLYPLLSDRAKRSLLQTQKGRYRAWIWHPSASAVRRLVKVLKWDKRAVESQLRREREFLLAQQGHPDYKHLIQG